MARAGVLAHGKTCDHGPDGPTLSCGRCDRPICGRCAVTSIVGTRCRNCAPQIEKRGAAARAEAEGTLFGIKMTPEVKLGVFAFTAVVVVAVLGWAWQTGDRERFIVRSIVFGGFLASTVLHEFAHGLVAYLGGDRSVKSRGFLTLNPLKYIDPVYSIGLPMLFVLAGGIPLIGGRTLIHRENLRSKWWDTAVSLAGPATNLVIGAALALLWRFGVLGEFTAVAWGVAFLAFLQVGTAFFNLLPIPPLDGFGAIAGHLSHETRTRAYSYGNAGFFILLILMWNTNIGSSLWDAAFDMTESLGVPALPIVFGDGLSRLR